MLDKTHLTSSDVWYAHAGIDISGAQEGYAVLWSDSLNRFIVGPVNLPDMSDYALVDHGHGDFLPLSGGDLTGYISLHADPSNPDHPATKSYVDAATSTIITDHGEQEGLGDDDHPQYILVNASRAFSSTPFVGANKIWHAGNDGPNSGLDADLLDGMEAADFSLDTHTHPEYSDTVHDHDDQYVNESDHTKAAHDALGIDAASLDGIDSSAFLRSDQSDTAFGDILFDSSAIRFSSASGTGDWQIYKDSAGDILFTIGTTGGAEMALSSDGSSHTNAVLRVAGNTVFTTANHGSSGDPHSQYLLESEADTRYLNSSTNDTYSSGTLTFASGTNLDVTAGTILVSTPANDNQAANKQYVDSVVEGLQFKESVRLVATTSVTRSGLQTIDGVSLNTDDRVLLAGQGGGDNGIWLARDTAWVRPDDFNEDAEISEGTFVFVEEGVQFEATGWVLSELSGTYPSFTVQDWTQFSRGETVTAGAGLLKTGNTIDIGSGDGINVSTDAIAVVFGTPAGSLTPGGGNSAGTATSVAHSDHKHDITGVALEGHNHDTRYYTETEIGTLLSGKSDTGHAHAAGDITSGAFANARIAQSNVTQHQAALAITQSQITDLDHYASSDFNTDFAAKSTTDLAEGTNLYYTATRVNSAIDTRVSKSFIDALNVDADTLDGMDASGFAASGHGHDYAGSSHTHVEADITNLDHYSDADANLAIDTRVTKLFVDALNVDADTVDGLHATAFAPVSHNHAASSITSGTFADARISQTSVTQHQAAIAISESQITNLNHYTNNDANAAIDTRVTKIFVDNLNVDADTVDGLHAASFSLATHNHDTDYSGAGHNHDGTYYTETEIDTLLAGKSNTGHNHPAADIASGTFADARISQSSVTQHQAALTISESQIANLVHYTSANFTTDFNSRSTSDLSEGTNLYYTSARVNSAIDTRVVKSYIDALDIDADTVDGQHASAFASSGHNHDSAYVNAAGDTFTGELKYSTFSNISDPVFSTTLTSWGSTPAMRIFADGAIRWGTGAAFDTLLYRSGSGTLTLMDNLVVSGTLTAGGNNVLTTADEGTGNGLDADTVDGQHASAFAISGHDHHDQYYTESESDSRFVNVAGDNMTGNLFLTADNTNLVLGVAATSGDRLRFHRSGSNQYVDYGTGSMHFRAGGSGNAMVLTSSSNIGVGTASPEEVLDVQGNVRIREESSIKYGGVGASDAAFAIHYNASTQSLDFDFVGA